VAEEGAQGLVVVGVERIDFQSHATGLEGAVVDCQGCRVAAAVEHEECRQAGIGVDAVCEWGEEFGGLRSAAGRVPQARALLVEGFEEPMGGEVLLEGCLRGVGGGG